MKNINDETDKLKKKIEEDYHTKKLAFILKKKENSLIEEHTFDLQIANLKTKISPDYFSTSLIDDTKNDSEIIFDRIENILPLNSFNLLLDTSYLYEINLNDYIYIIHQFNVRELKIIEDFNLNNLAAFPNNADINKVVKYFWKNDVPEINDCYYVPKYVIIFIPSKIY